MAGPAAGSRRRRLALMLEEVRITGLGVINDALLELSPGFTALTGETGAGKTMVVTGLGLLFGGRADPARVRPGAQRASVEGRLRTDPRGKVASQVEEAGGELDEDGTLVLTRTVFRRGAVPRVRRRPLGAGVAAQLPRRRPGRGARPVRPAAAAQARQAARVARQVRRRGARRGPRRLPARLRQAPDGRRGAHHLDHAGAGAGRRGRRAAGGPGGHREAQPGGGGGGRAARGGGTAGQRRRAARRRDRRARGAARRPGRGQRRHGRGDPARPRAPGA